MNLVTGNLDSAVSKLDELETVLFAETKESWRDGVSLHSLTGILGVTEILYFKETIGVEERRAIIGHVGRGKVQ